MIIKVKVKPSSKEEKIEKISTDEYFVWLKEPAENNKANNRLTNLLAKEFSVSYKNIKINTPSSRNKIIDINL